MGKNEDEEDPEIQRDFDRKKVIFEQDCQEYRSLNGFLWQLPVIVSTLTGGLWFGATKVCDNQFIQWALFAFAGLANICFILILWRLRAGVMESILNRIALYQGYTRPKRKYFMILLYALLLLVAAGFRFTAAYKSYYGAEKVCTYARG